MVERLFIQLYLTDEPFKNGPFLSDTYANFRHCNIKCLAGRSFSYICVKNIKSFSNKKMQAQEKWDKLFCRYFKRYIFVVNCYYCDIRKLLQSCVTACRAYKSI